MSFTFGHLASKAWWKDATFRAIRTAIAAAIPLFASVSLLDVDWLVALSTVGLAVVASYVTSLGGLPELDSANISKSWAIATRAVKTFAQVLAGYLGTAVLFQDVDWSTGLAMSLSATVVSLLSGTASSLPETEEVLQ